ncbi:hypothetical protein CLIM01_13325 [Colletotrichum limetticola]|uniref:Uncharacterized protein n=1 Tax=Colletotrichum limetticola TaxID=1209924 RepID=A0ABQ9PFU9_9PEZI|nr:hypothetical protein CLIM01_13325 [Colletotrichum limetticola]
MCASGPEAGGQRVRHCHSRGYQSQCQCQHAAPSRINNTLSTQGREVHQQNQRKERLLSLGRCEMTKPCRAWDQFSTYSGLLKQMMGRSTVSPPDTMDTERIGQDRLRRNTANTIAPKLTKPTV